MKMLLLGLGTAITLSLPSTALAQTAYVPITPEYECEYVDGLLCYDTLDNNDKVVYMLVTYYGDWYMLAVQEFGPHNMMYIVDIDGNIVSQMMLSNRLTAVTQYQGRSTSEGDLEFFQSFTEEFAFLMRSRDWP